jgi:hypothetical protein
VVYQVPSDDTHTWRYNFRFQRSAPFAPGDDTIDRDQAQIARDYYLLANQRNGYLLDRDKQRTRNYTGIDGFATQDACVTESMGAITDRSKETLGTTDAYVIALRRFLLKAVKDFQRGAEPPGLVYDPADNDYTATVCTWTTVPPDGDWKRAEAELYGPVLQRPDARTLAHV